MPERFFAGNSARVFSAAEELILLSGPPACGKTSLLFQFALNCVMESSRKVVFICNKKRLDPKLPFLSQGMDPGPQILGRIQMKYVEDADEIKKVFAAFHLHDIFPAAVIIDDFGEFFSVGNVQNKYCRRGSDAAMVGALALCQNALSHANAKLQPDGACKLLLSDINKADVPRLFIYKRWIQSIFTIKGGGSGSFFLKNMANPGTKPTRLSTAKYSIACQYLIMEGMVEDEASFHSK